MKNYIITLILFLFAVTAYSQEVNCATAIKDAEEMYRNGNYESAVQLLNSILKQCTLSKREKEDAYIILTQACLEKENYVDANHLIVKILNNDPNFKLKEKLYQEDFYAYYNRIKIRPMLSAGLLLGSNSPNFSIKKVYSVYNSAKYSATYKPTMGYQYGAFAEWQFYDNISVVAEGAFSKMGYNRTINGTSIDTFKLSYSEQIKSFETSLYVKKYFLHKQFKPFIYAGGYITALQKSTASVDLDYKLADPIAGGIDNYNSSENNIDVIAMRNKTRQGIVSGAGISYKSKNFLICAYASYRVDISKHITNSQNRFKNDDLLFKYYYVDNDVNLSRIDVSLSVSYIFKYSIKSK